MGTRPGGGQRAAVLVLAVLVGAGWPAEGVVAQPGGIAAAIARGDECPRPGAINPDTGRPYRPTSDCPNSAPMPEPSHSGSDGDGAKVAALAVGLGLLFAAAAASANDTPKPPPPPRPPTPDELLANGPLVFAANALGTFSAYGFVQNDAPIVVDVQADPGARTQLNITVGGRTSSIPLEPGREPLVIRYPGGGAAEPQVALLNLTSTVRNNRGKEAPSPIQVTGLGAGERAMGSVAINRLSFGPPLLQSAAGGQATLGYVTESPFDVLATDILRYWRGSGNSIVVQRVWRRTYRQLNARAYSGGPWNGRDAANKASKGSHLLQVTGWELSGDRAWVAAFSPTNVEVK